MMRSSRRVVCWLVRLLVLARPAWAFLPGEIPMLTAAQRLRLEEIRAGSLTKRDIEIVIARYDEDVGWSDMYAPLLTIYNKGKVILTGDKHAEVVPLPNIGRETHTYLTHIVKNYDRLALVTVFSQGGQPNAGYRPAGGVGGHLLTNSTFHDFVLSSSHKGHFVFTHALFLPTLAHVDRPGWNRYTSSIEPGVSTRLQALQQCPDPPLVTLSNLTRWALSKGLIHHIAQRCSEENATVCSSVGFWDRFVRLPRPKDDIIYMSQGGLFAATREQIRRRPREEYDAILREIERSRQIDSYVGYFMEWFWQYVVRSEVSPCGATGEGVSLEGGEPHLFAWAFSNIKNGILDLRNQSLILTKERMAARRRSNNSQSKGTGYAPSVPLLERLNQKLGPKYSGIFSSVMLYQPLRNNKHKQHFKTLGDRFTAAVKGLQRAGLENSTSADWGGVGVGGDLAGASKFYKRARAAALQQRPGPHPLPGAGGAAPTRRPLLCATFLSCNPYALEFLQQNIEVSRHWCDWAVVFYQGDPREIAEFETRARARDAAVATAGVVGLVGGSSSRPGQEQRQNHEQFGRLVLVATHSDLIYNNETMGYIPKPLLYSHLAPLLRGYERIWLLDGDMNLKGFNFRRYIAMQECAEEDMGRGGASRAGKFTSPSRILISQPIIKESTQFYTVVNQNFWHTGGAGRHYLLDTAVQWWQYVEIQAPLMDSRFFEWFLTWVLEPMRGLYRNLQSDWGMDQSWCHAAKEFLEWQELGSSSNSSAGRRRATPCAIVMEPLSHQKSSAMQVKALHSKALWRRWLHTNQGFLSAELHHSIFPQWFVSNFSIAFRADRAAFLAEGWPRLSQRKIEGCVQKRAGAMAF